MRSFIRHFSQAVLMAGVLCITVTGSDAQTRKAPSAARFYVGEPGRAVRIVKKTSPTVVPVIDSNAILNLDYHELRSTPAAAPKPVHAAPVVAPKEPTLAELKLKLRTAEDNLKAANLAHRQAVRSKDKTRVAQAVKNRDAARKEVGDLKKAVAAKEPAKTTKKRKAPKKNTPGTGATSSVPVKAK